eukprot:2980576-Prorocentrum_lima.AAC.1
MTVDASRGRTAPMVYVLKHPRTVGAPAPISTTASKATLPGSMSTTREPATCASCCWKRGICRSRA